MAEVVFLVRGVRETMGKNLLTSHSDFCPSVLLRMLLGPSLDQGILGPLSFLDLVDLVSIGCRFYKVRLRLSLNGGLVIVEKLESSFAIGVQG